MLLFVIAVSGSSAKAQSVNPRFLDGPRIASTALNFSLRTFDTVETCRNLDRGGKEYFLPTQRCSGVASISAAYTIGAFALERVLYKHHPRLARIPQIVSTAGAVSGIAFSAKHGGIR